MTPDQFNATLAAIGWSRRELADKLGLTSDRVVRLWAGGKVAVPPAIAGWLRQVTEALDTLPPPKDWTERGPA